MKNLVLILCLTIFFMIQLAESNQILKDDANGETVSYPRTSSNIYLKKAVGEGIEIMSEASTEAYEVYFHVPISFGGQVPILIEVESPNLIDYRFIRLPNSPNILCAAKLISGVTSLNWTAWVIIEKSHYSDVPDSVPIPQSQNLPDSVLQWLQSSDCIQTSAPIVQETAASIRGTTSNLITLADSIADYCHNIPGYFYHEPIAFDAVYTLNWGIPAPATLMLGQPCFGQMEYPPVPY